MSYCRWSNDDYQCDVYVYADVAGGFTTHVASVRVTFASELPPPLPDGAIVDDYIRRHELVSVMLKDASTAPIGLPHDGDTFNVPDAQAAAILLENLRTAGYRVPQYAIDALWHEWREQFEAPTKGEGNE